MSDDQTPLEAAEAAKKSAAARDAADAKRKSNLVRAGIGLGIGSAAIAAALLYANSNRKKKSGSES